MKKLSIIAAVLMFLGIASSALATPMNVGEVLQGNSWGQGFYENGIGTFDQMELLSLTGSDFENPAFRNLPSGWTNTNLSSLYATASGSDSSYVSFEIWFNGNTQATSFLFMASDNGSAKEYAQATYNGGGWTIVGSTANVWQEALARNNTAVPEPTTMMLLGLSLVGLAGVRIKFKN